MVHRPKKEHIDIFIMYGLSVCLIAVLSIINLVSKNQLPLIITPHKEEKLVTPPPFFDKKAFENLSIEANAYIIYDLTTHETLVSKNETAQLPLASLTKVMTAISSTLHKNKTDKIILREGSVEDGYDLGLKKNQEWTLGELLKYTLVFSSNDGAQAVADSFGNANFVAQMNTDSTALGLTAFFTDPAGRDVNGRIGGMGTALDVAKLFAVARKNIPELLDATTKKRSTVTVREGKLSGIPNTNQEVETLPGAEASKTGYTDLAGGNLAVIVDVTLGRPVVIVVLGSTREGRFRDVDTLYNALRKSAIDVPLPK